MNKKLFFSWILVLSLLCCTACGKRMNSATDGSDKTNQNTQDTTVEDNNGNGTLTNGTTNDNVIDGVVNGVEDTVDGVIDGVDDVIDGTENTINDSTRSTR